MANELSAPLLGRKARKRAAQGGRWHFPIARVTLLAVLVIVGAVALRVMLVEDPNGGRPEAEVAIASTRDGNPLTATVTDPAAANQAVITVDPGEIAVPALEGGPSITEVTDDLIKANSIMLLDGSGVVADLAEESENGPIPRVATDGFIRRRADWSCPR